MGVPRHPEPVRTPLGHHGLGPCAPGVFPLSPLSARDGQRLGRDDVGVPISSDPIASLFGLSKQRGVGPVKDANRMALRIPALCGLPTPEEAQQVLESTVAQQQALTDGVSSLTKQRRQMRTDPPHLEQLGNGRDQGNVELIPPGKDPSDQSNVIYLPHGYKEVEGPLPQCHEVSPTQARGVGNQVQKPVKSRTPI